MNPKAETVEGLLGRRKGLHLGMLKLALEDLALTLQAALDSHVVPPFPAYPFVIDTIPLRLRLCFVLGMASLRWHGTRFNGPTVRLATCDTVLPSKRAAL